MTRGLKIHWTLWITLVILIATGALIDDASSAKSITMVLRPKESMSVSVFRPLPHTLNLVFDFNRMDGRKALELGDWATGDDWQKTGFLAFSNAGVPIKLQVRRDSQEAIYETLPASSYGGNTVGRDLVPFVEDGNPRRFNWPPNVALALPLSVGVSTLNITVLEVGEQLLGEQVVLIIKSPVTFKTVSDGYGWLWWFMFWPVYALLLAAYGAILLWKTTRKVV